MAGHWSHGDRITLTSVGLLRDHTSYWFGLGTRRGLLVTSEEKETHTCDL